MRSAAPIALSVRDTKTAPSSRGVRLRRVEPGDLSTLHRFQLDPESNTLAAVKPRDRAAFDAHWRRVLADPEVIAMTVLAESEIVGSVSCFRSDGQDMVGYWIGREHWGRGIATRAVALLLEQVTARPLHARVARHNGASIRVLEKCGFRAAGYVASPETDRFLACEEAIMVLA